MATDRTLLYHSGSTPAASLAVQSGVTGKISYRTADYFDGKAEPAKVVVLAPGLAGSVRGKAITAAYKAAGIEVRALEAPKPKEKSDPEGDLPEETPKRKELVAGGVTTPEALAAHLEAGTLTDIDGIGEATAKQIAEFVAGLDD